jgi:hypothetical protein
LACAAEAGANSAGREVKPGAGQGFRVASRATVIQIRGGQNPTCPSHQPHWGFRFLLLLCVCHERSGEGAPPPRRAEEEQVGRRAAAGDRRGREGPNQSPQGRKESFASGKEPDRSRDQDAVVNAYAAPPSTPSRPRLHRRPDVSTASVLFTFSPPWLLRCVEPAALGCAAV